ncbi:phosphatidylinositol-glycan biosynthesis class X protein isoform X1 [Anguilla anguilla]|uniref:phosphatidylinositol-glycan biosynthesis class X protein isoform X1 n=1 Tax=Anguilla anguilla TaxID=7936 RepID=UPI0015B31688|nr:phosphatidylinositol-glycan biosynthesis class X protein isoform X1 [Anguilla anguilla]
MVTKVFLCAIFLVVEIYGVAKTEEDNCDLSGEWLESLKVTRDIWKMGFHRELVTTMECGRQSPEKLHALLVQNLPRGVFVDPYQLASLQQDTGLQALLHSKVDLEAPAYESNGLSMFVYPKRDPGRPGHLQAVLPIHGRYHRPSSGQGWERIEIEPPRLFLRANGCAQHLAVAPPVLMDAPCSGHNMSMCKWMEVQLPQVLQASEKDQRHISLELPVGDWSLAVPVCGGTLLVTLLCCVLIANAIQRHGFQ